MLDEELGHQLEGGVQHGRYLCDAARAVTSSSALQ